MSAEAPVGPALLLHTLGKGRVVTIAASPDVATGGEHAIVEARTLLANAVRMLIRRPRLRIEAPAYVEAVASEEPGARRLHVHLIAYCPTPATTPPKNRPYILPGLIEDPPEYRARIRLQESPRSARAWGKNTVIERKGDEILVRAGDVHEVITVDY
jgi:hypothetical protein